MKLEVHIDDTTLAMKVDQVLVLERKIMAGITDILNAQSAEKTDLVELIGLQNQLLTAFASGNLTPAQAQAVLDEIAAEDASVKSASAVIKAALPAA